MTSPDDTGHLGPEDDAAVRRLLGTVGAQERPALPPAVAERLDATLSGLVAERASSATDGSGSERAGGAPPVDLAAVRRRRTVIGLLVAAAAVVAIAAGVPLLKGDHSQVGTSASGAADRSSASVSPRRPAPVAPGAQSHAQSHAQSDAQPENGSARAGGRSQDKVLGGAAVPRVRSAHLRDDLLALRREVPPRASYSSRSVHLAPGLVCDDGPFGRGVLIGVRYDAAPAVVAFRAPTRSTQVAEVLQCGSADVIGSITLPPPP